MSGIFDRLHTQIGGQHEGGISPIDLAKLPREMKSIMRLMLREVEMSEEQLVAAIQEWPEEERLSADQISAALKILVKDGWLIKMGEERITYRANLRRKAGSQLNFWSKLDDRIAETRTQPKHEDSESESA